MNYAATSASWTNSSSPVPSYHINRKNSTLSIVKETSSRYGWDPFHMMVMGYLHDQDMNNGASAGISNYTHLKSFIDFDISTGNNENYISYVYKTLKKAPCEGPYTFPEFTPGDSQVSGDIGPKGWNMSKRWFGPKYLATNNYQYKMEDGVNVLRDRTSLPVGGFYTGLDFMMLHNLYYLNSNQFLPKYVNYIDRHYDEDLYNNLVGYSPLTIAGYESLTADNTIGSQMEVTYQASTEIHLTTDFHATAGVEFHAVIQDVTCGLDFKSTTLDTTQSSYGMSAFGERKVYADVSDKFEHLYVLPDSITTEFLELQIEKMNKTNAYDEDAFSYDFSSCALELKSNTVTDNLNFEVESSTENVTAYKIFDLNGKLVVEGALSPYQNSLSISQLPAGMFLIQVVSSSQNCSAKFVKN